MFERYFQRFQRNVEKTQYQAIQLISVRKTYLERRDKNKLRKMAEVTEVFVLSQEQVNAATSHFKETLVIAGAGSGKTSVLIGRAKYLVEFGRARGDQILMLAYNKDAASELSERASASEIDVVAQTFHAFGNGIVNYGGAKTGAAFGGKGEVASFLSKQLERGLDDPSRSELAKYFSQELVPIREFKDFKNLNEYAAYVRATIPRTLKDEQVKSHGEWLIANFLYTHGIEYEYEPVYNVGNSSKDRHRPDFVLHQSGAPSLWVEYFGTDREGGVAPSINPSVYNKSIEWKKGVHSKNGSKLIDLYFYDLKEETLLSKLQESLRSNGFKPSRKTSDEILAQANTVGYTSRFLHVTEQFLSHTRAKRLTQKELQDMASGNPRDEIFVKIFIKILSAYEFELAEKGLPDYAEQIHGAADRILAGEVPFPFTHVLVDEFQDISADRNRLLDAMKSANPELELTCVGDDWQSIYRFGGSDVSIMQEASKPKMIRKRVNLTNTYRLPQNIADISRSFILKNPLQLEKQVNSRSKFEEPGEIVFHWDTEQKESEENLKKVIKRIGADAENPELSLKILARYADNLPEISLVQNLWEGLADISTIHAAKGLEADYVVIMDLVQDFRGFPSTIEDDPVIRLVMSDKESQLHGEERRLFYVAVTRARRATHIISPMSAPSVFASELYKDGLAKHIGIDEAKNRVCPVCQSGRILVSGSGNGSYCSNIPLCDFRAPKCNQCSSPMEMTGDTKDRYVCNQHPEVQYRSCDACEWGVLIPRLNSVTQQVFYSCHTWSKTRCSGKSK